MTTKKNNSRITLLQVEVSERLEAGSPCCVFQRRLLVPSSVAYADFVTRCILVPGDLILIPEDGVGAPAELMQIKGQQAQYQQGFYNYQQQGFYNYRFCASPVYHATPVLCINNTDIV